MFRRNKTLIILFFILFSLPSFYFLNIFLKKISKIDILEKIILILNFSYLEL